MIALEHFAAQIGEHVSDHSQDEACEALWRAVIKRAVQDHQRVERTSRLANPTTHDKAVLRRIYRNPPDSFFASEWFETPS